MFVGHIKNTLLHLILMSILVIPLAQKIARKCFKRITKFLLWTKINLGVKVDCLFIYLLLSFWLWPTHLIEDAMLISLSKLLIRSFIWFYANFTFLMKIIQGNSFTPNISISRFHNHRKRRKLRWPSGLLNKQVILPELSSEIDLYFNVVIIHRSTN